MTGFLREMLHKLSKERGTEDKPTTCKFCGAAVNDFPQHYQFHARLAQLVPGLPGQGGPIR